MNTRVHLFEHLFSILGGSARKESACHAGDLGSIPGSERSPGEGNCYPLQYSCLENPTDRGAWWATVHGVTKSRIWLNNFHNRLRSGIAGSYLIPELFHHRKEKLSHPLSKQFLPNFPSPQQTRICFPSPWICLFWTFHIQGFIWYGAFYVLFLLWMCLILLTCTL